MREIAEALAKAQATPFQAFNISKSYGTPANGYDVQISYDGGNTSPYGQEPKLPTGPQDGNWANYPSPDRPPPFTASYGSIFGGSSPQPAYAQRDAFIQSLNNQETPYMVGAKKGPIQYDIPAAKKSAEGMVNGGYRNPFSTALPAVSSSAFATMYKPSPRAAQTPRPVQQQPSVPSASRAPKMDAYAPAPVQQPQAVAAPVPVQQAQTVSSQAPLQQAGYLAPQIQAPFTAQGPELLRQEQDQAYNALLAALYGAQ